MIGFLSYSRSVLKAPPVTGSRLARMAQRLTALPKMDISLNFMKSSLICNMIGFQQKNQIGRSSGTREPVPGYPEVATNTPEWFWQSCIVFLVSFMDQFQLS
uniref:(northern house mosquito) hypothetical protein n=1 Tax=Culex pipiens TaxID=7175 RepID=A0A8D8CHP7_CULPI